NALAIISDTTPTGFHAYKYSCRVSKYVGPILRIRLTTTESATIVAPQANKKIPWYVNKSPMWSRTPANIEITAITATNTTQNVRPGVNLNTFSKKFASDKEPLYKLVTLIRTWVMTAKSAPKIPNIPTK